LSDTETGRDINSRGGRQVGRGLAGLRAATRWLTRVIPPSAQLYSDSTRLQGCVKAPLSCTNNATSKFFARIWPASRAIVPSLTGWIFRLADPKEVTMTTRTSRDKLQGSNPSLPATWAAISAQIVEQLDEPNLPELIIQALRTQITFGYSLMFVYREKGHPIHIYDTLNSPQAQTGLINFAKNTYVLNPFYNAYRNGLKTGVYRMSDFVPLGFFNSDYYKKFKVSASSSEEIGYLTKGLPSGGKELCIAIELPFGECAAITLNSKKVKDRYSAANIAALTEVLPFLAAVFRRFWRQRRTIHKAAGPDFSAEIAFKDFGGNLLSPREREIAQLLLRGHSTQSVSLQLNVAVTTVKTHRKNLYAKLGIATQFELYSLFLDSLLNRRRL
jgi:DNA-binding CsgD family transcriptional regulator